LKGEGNFDWNPGGSRETESEVETDPEVEMKTVRVLAVMGGNSKGSLNKKLLMAAKEAAPQGFELTEFNLAELPFFSQDLEKDPPKIIGDFKKTIEDCDAVLFITPEYNRSFPGILKNAIDWGSRPPDRNSWKKKPAGIMGASSGNIGTSIAQSHLRQVLSHLDLRVLNQPEFFLNGSKAFDENGVLTDARTKDFIGKYWGAFSEWITQQKLLREALSADA
jgi:chromate reductase